MARLPVLAGSTGACSRVNGSRMSPTPRCRSQFDAGGDEACTQGILSLSQSERSGTRNPWTSSRRCAISMQPAWSANSGARWTFSLRSPIIGYVTARAPTSPRCPLPSAEAKDLAVPLVELGLQPRPWNWSSVVHAGVKSWAVKRGWPSRCRSRYRRLAERVGLSRSGNLRAGPAAEDEAGRWRAAVV